MKAQKKPVIIDFHPIDIKSNTKLIKWINSFGDDENDVLKLEKGEWKVKTLEGTSYKLSSDDIIIRGLKGEYYPCKKDIFKKTYTVIK